LDWRLGVGFLRSLLDRKYSHGLDGDWSGAPELSDWPRLAADAAEELRRLDPTRRSVEHFGPLGLPVLLRPSGGETEAYIFVHPFWRLDEAARASSPLAETITSVPHRQIYFIDTFDVARRPVKALEHARSRTSEMP
jgi:hypothetical protein